MKSIKITALLGFLLLFSGALEAQITDKPEYGKIAIIGATVHTVSNGSIEQGIVTIHNGNIEYVGTDRSKVGSDYKVIEATGKHVYPGFMDSGTSLGLVEINAVPVTVDNREVGNINPNMLALLLGTLIVQLYQLLV